MKTFIRNILGILAAILVFSISMLIISVITYFLIRFDPITNFFGERGYEFYTLIAGVICRILATHGAVAAVSMISTPTQKGYNIGVIVVGLYFFIVAACNLIYMIPECFSSFTFKNVLITIENVYRAVLSAIVVLGNKQKKV